MVLTKTRNLCSQLLEIVCEYGEITTQTQLNRCCMGENESPTVLVRPWAQAISTRRKKEERLIRLDSEQIKIAPRHPHQYQNRIIFTSNNPPPPLIFSLYHQIFHLLPLFVLSLPPFPRSFSSFNRCHFSTSNITQSFLPPLICRLFGCHGHRGLGCKWHPPLACCCLPDSEVAPVTNSRRFSKWNLH